MRILITGGSGTVGSAFIQAYERQHEFAILSRNEKLQWEAQAKFPQLTCYLGGVEQEDAVLAAYDRFQPEAVIHAAALKHIDLAEKQPIQTCRVNIVGMLNVVAASRRMQTPITLGISTDKACSHSVYGVSKFLLERCFLEANTPRTHFAVCRFGNVAKSNGSVIPRWLEAAARGEKLMITDPAMCRMMISQPNAAKLIHRALDLCRDGGGFVLLKRLKQVNILDLARQISSNYEVVGARAGEQQHETLLSPAEIPYAEVLADDYIRLGAAVNANPATQFALARCDSASSERMTEQEIRELIAA